MTTNAEFLLDELGGSLIRFMTYLLLWDAPDNVFNRWNESLGTDREFDMRQSTWRIILCVEAQMAERA